jgi:hypothetical protein
MTATLDLLDTLRSHGITLTVKDDSLLAKPAANVNEQLVNRIRERKPRLIAILQGDVAACEHCCGSVVRDRTFDGYWNRFCVDCGRWFRCEKE